MGEKMIEHLNRYKLIIELHEALVDSKKQIRAWHGIGMPEQIEKEIWSIYDNQAPDMKRLNEVIAKTERLLSMCSNFPKIVCLCGSTRFYSEFQEANLRETLAGNIVLSIGCSMKSDQEHFGNLPEDELKVIKTNLDELHKRKIDLADEILVLNVGGYIGDSTKSEIDYAITLNRGIRWLEDPLRNADGILYVRETRDKANNV